MSSPATLRTAATTDAAHRETKPSVMAGEFLQWRAKLLEVAAGLDRLDRADGTLDAAEQQQLELIREAIKILDRHDPSDDRAGHLQMLFSRPYDPTWREQFGL